MDTKTRELYPPRTIGRSTRQARPLFGPSSLGKLALLLNFLLRVSKLGLFLGLVWLGLVLVFPALSPSSLHIAVIGMEALFVAISVKDLQQERIPNLLTYALMLAGVIRAVIMHDPSFLAYWAVLWLAWSANFMGAGDAKLLMGLFGLWPDMRLAYVIAGSILLTGLPYLIFKYRRRWRSAVRGLAWRLFTLQLLPSPQEFQHEAVPFAFSFCLAGGVYLWLRLGWA